MKARVTVIVGQLIFLPGILAMNSTFTAIGLAVSIVGAIEMGARVWKWKD